MTLVAIVARDLIIATRIGEAAAAAGHEVVRVDGPDQLPPPSSVTAVFVDWADRGLDWGEALVTWLASGGEQRPRLVVFGPHTDVEAHRAARSAGVGPMIARSKLVASLTAYLAG